ncbi:hypothetical protein PCANC_03981 [Puccinia coronata f. sp. avenae]|uniref:Uncharacterized protein n=1 Tax=Puccinia coronata f. sp. avenae TaxID=200324 RepID=A0A2N5T7S8_9BASI|nr:hypothetical protein PCANC_03981 [Puccinia coronata f. sp. avenae]
MAEFLGEHAAQSTQLAANSQTANTTDERVAKLTSDMANIDARLSTLVDLLNTSPIFNPPPPPESQQQQGSNAHHMPPPPQSARRFFGPFPSRQILSALHGFGIQSAEKD